MLLESINPPQVIMIQMLALGLGSERVPCVTVDLGSWTMDDDDANMKAFQCFRAITCQFFKVIQFGNKLHGNPSGVQRVKNRSSQIEIIKAYIWEAWIGITIAKLL